MATAYSAPSDEQEFDHFPDVEEVYKCAICMEIYNKPTRTECGHIFCFTCLRESLQRKNQCPQCRDSIKKSAIQDARDIERRLAEHEATCKYCQETVTLSGIRIHKKRCIPSVRPKAIQQRERLVDLSCLQPNRQTFPCAYCKASNFSREGLLEHCAALHKNAPDHRLVCTICIAYPWGNREQISENLYDHIMRRHQFDYERVVDFNETEEQMMKRAVQQSLHNA